MDKNLHNHESFIFKFHFLDFLKALHLFHATIFKSWCLQCKKKLSLVSFCIVEKIRVQYDGKTYFFNFFQGIYQSRNFFWPFMQYSRINFHHFFFLFSWGVLFYTQEFFTVFWVSNLTILFDMGLKVGDWGFDMWEFIFLVDCDKCGEFGVHDRGNRTMKVKLDEI